jgi:Flp pilus assembly secretin CpaC
MRNTLLALAVLSLSLPALAADTTPVKLQVGDHTQLDVANLSRISIGDPVIADVKVVGGTTFEVDALCPGKTQLLAWGGDQRYAFALEVTGTPRVPAACAGKTSLLSPVPEARTVMLAAGESTTLPAPKADQLLAAQPRIAQAHAQAAGKVRIDAGAPGKTSLILLRQGRVVEVWAIEVQ